MKSLIGAAMNPNGKANGRRDKGEDHRPIEEEDRRGCCSSDTILKFCNGNARRKETENAEETQNQINLQEKLQSCISSSYQLYTYMRRNRRKITKHSKNRIITELTESS